MSDTHGYGANGDGLIEDVGEFINDKVRRGLKGLFRGAVHVLTSGFGKGMLIAAAVTAVAAIGFGMATVPGISLATAVSHGLSGTMGFLFSPPGLAILGAGGLAGAVISSHGKNKQLSKSEAEDMAQYYQRLREQGSTPDMQPSVQEEVQAPCHGGHCAQLMQERKQQAQMQR